MGASLLTNSEIGPQTIKSNELTFGGSLKAEMKKKKQSGSFNLPVFENQVIKRLQDQNAQINSERSYNSKKLFTNNFIRQNSTGPKHHKFEEESIKKTKSRIEFSENENLSINSRSKSPSQAIGNVKHLITDPDQEN